MKNIQREILLGFWKAHILHHAAEANLHGHWMLSELRGHGYDISPGTLYPLLQRMEKLGWLKCKTGAKAGGRTRKNYRLTPSGKKVLELVRGQIVELYEEIVKERKHRKK
ncbi:MAG TPA: PadR family transcriptional regulator [Verrucomicrobiae bacterium]|nr:PadR family transcriptional regulator [Verrucomicrobiae bacterium]